MADPRFFAEEICVGRVTLSEAEAHHAAHVQRLSVGAGVVLFDGRGNWGHGQIVQSGRRQVVVDVRTVGRDADEFGISLTIATAIPKSARQNFLFEKCTELGVSTIVPLVTARSVVKPAANSIDKWRRVTVEAAKQCRRNRLPTISKPLEFEESLEVFSSTPIRCMAHVDDGGVLFGRYLAGICGESMQAKESDSLVVWVGPEGGWSDDEIASATSAGVTMVGLSAHVLRMETAAIAVAAMVEGLRPMKGE